ncbi:unnamed protein product [Rotaria sp. Silwood2]|nr:unnamed protein product [Rotaria sp. Silwood2]CAF2709853.1 unnamed protein product [Rotaria sp. Silwood2]CAF4344437.1 unnamed protein product [Rotaria sp. Silwood2]CAF4584317.1 unnamed protein product [Rotaria sp. Silwood2]
MDQREPVEQTKNETINKTSPISDIDQLCNLIDESTFGGCVQGSSYKSSNLSLRFRSVPSCQVKAFRSSRLKRLNSSSISKIQEEGDYDDDDDNNNIHEKVSCRSLVPYTRRTFSMRFSLSSPSLLNRFRSLSTCHFPQSRRNSHLSSNIRSHHIRYSSPTTLTLFRTKSILPAIVEEESNIDNSLSSPTTSQSQLSCTIVDTRRPTANSCNVEELAAYLDNFLYLPKSLSGAAELMYT